VVEADPVRLAQVFSNLLNNSAKYTDQDGRIKLAVALEGSDVIISVADTGIGIPKETLPFIFDMFAQAEKSPSRIQAGLGIGLTLAKQLVEMHGGRIDARSEGVGRGSEFSVRLPVALSPQAVQGTEAGRKSQNAVWLPRRRILVIDDMKESAEVLATLLRTRGQQVDVAFDGASGIELVIASRPEIVFIDLGMPEMNGYEVAQRLRARPELRQTVLVALTGYVQEAARQQALEAGFDQYLLKPADMRDLEQIVVGSAEPTAIQ
jgi:CheY-like chemotaxis protein